MSNLIIVIIVLFFIGILGSFIFLKFHNKKEKPKTFFKQNKTDFVGAKKNYSSLSKKKKDSHTLSKVKEIPVLKKANSGIYAIYFPSQNVKEIIPVYIGQAKDIRSRWMQHINELNKVHIGSSDSRKYAKMLHYAQQRKLKVDDLQFLILKETKVKHLDFEESEYIKAFGSDIYGFNSTKGNTNSTSYKKYK